MFGTLQNSLNALKNTFLNYISVKKGEKVANAAISVQNVISETHLLQR